MAMVKASKGSNSSKVKIFKILIETYSFVQRTSLSRPLLVSSVYYLHREKIAKHSSLSSFSCKQRSTEGFNFTDLVHEAMAKATEGLYGRRSKLIKTYSTVSSPKSNFSRPLLASSVYYFLWSTWRKNSQGIGIDLRPTKVVFEVPPPLSRNVILLKSFCQNFFFKLMFWSSNLSFVKGGDWTFHDGGKSLEIGLPIVNGIQGLINQK